MSTAIAEHVDEVKTTPWSGGRSPFNVEYGKMMMWFFLLSDAFTFSTLLISYGAIRFSASTWPSASIVFKVFPGVSENAPLVFVGLMTFILIMSSVTMVLAVEAGHRNAKKEVVIWMLFTILGGLMFLSCQALEWTHLHSEGFWWGHIPVKEVMNEFFPKINGHVPPDSAQAMTSHQFANLFFTITGFHGFHVFSGVIINIIITINVLIGTYAKRGSYLMVEKVGLYWHFVDLVWVFVFTFFYLV